MEGCPVADLFSDVQYPWEVLPRIAALLEKVGWRTTAPPTGDRARVWVGEGTTVADTARFTARRFSAGMRNPSQRLCAW